jgi:hypothetical protein
MKISGNFKNHAPFCTPQQKTLVNNARKLIYKDDVLDEIIFIDFKLMREKEDLYKIVRL